MIRLLSGLVPPWAWAAALAVALAVAWLWHSGEVRAARKAGADEVRAEAAEAVRRKEQEQRAREQAAEFRFEALRADKERANADAARRLSAALQQPISCPAALADVVLPAAVVDELRAAGTDTVAAEPAAGEPGRPVRPGPALP